MKIKSLLKILVVITLFTSCANSNEDQGLLVDKTHGSPIGLVWLWTVDSDGAESGTATFELFQDNDNFYVKFYGKYYRLFRIIPYDTGKGYLTHTFTTVEGYQYYLKDVTDDDNWCFDLRGV
jgi:hypothetical protein